MSESEFSLLHADLEKIVGQPFVFVSEDVLREYGHDETEDLIFKPHVVVKPSNSQEISHLMKVANAKNIPVTVRGAGTGLSGSALPVRGGILISMERFDKLLPLLCSIDRR